ncbi:MAG: hypothetical protein AAGH67_00100 [Cyanobacteria bacterium P01_H01_bin.162]
MSVAQGASAIPVKLLMKLMLHVEDPSSTESQNIISPAFYSLDEVNPQETRHQKLIPPRWMVVPPLRGRGDDGMLVRLRVLNW